MSKKQKDPQTQKTPVQIGLWLVIGAGIGVLPGVFFNNIAMGITFGTALGLVFGAALSHKNKKE